jgi:hypothetical protein
MNSRSADQLGEIVFQRRLTRLKRRLAVLVNWPNPDSILEEIIKKVKRQQSRILIFVEHPGVTFHNNYTEYLIRIGVLKCKIPGGSVSAEGAEHMPFCSQFMSPVNFAVCLFPNT